MQPDLTKRLAAEALGTFGFFFSGFCGIAALVTVLGSIQTLGIAAGFGFGLALMIFAFGHISGGHFNPAVTAGLATARRFPTSEILPYWAAQLVGGLVAAILLRIIFSHFVVRATVNSPAANVSSFKAMVLEAVFTFLFLLVICTVATDTRAPWSGVFAPFAIGLFIFTAATVCGPLSGGSFNPARSIAPAIVATHFGDLWIYIVGPLIGGAIGGLVHGWFRADDAAAAPAA
jgi:MIP family channel proteins